MAARIIRIAVPVAAAVLVFSSCALVRPATTRLLGAARTGPVELDPGPVPVPHEPRVTGVGPTGQRIIDEWAAMELPDWKTEGKVTAPRVMLAKLARGRDVDLVNEYLLAAKPWAGVGSTWGLRPNGDYDFSLPPLTAILYKYGDRPDVLYPETRDHLLTALLNQEGRRFTTTVPGSLRLVTETENHILMINGSRYLKNQWLREHGNDDPRYDNEANGLEANLVDFIRETELAGPYEFNSTPYLGYTAMALLTLEAYAAPPVAHAARDLLDRMNYEYAIGSLGLRRYPVFRRQPSRADRTSLTDNPHTALMRVWVSQLTGGIDYPVAENTHQALYAALMPYRLPVEIARLATSVDRDYFVRIGRGPGASPEIYTGGPGYLLSSGGTGRPALSLIVARPITLLLDDGADDLSGLFWIGGAGDYHSWNNSGVLPDFAVARSPAHVPPSPSGRRVPAAAGRTWRAYVVPDGRDRAAPTRLLVAVADTGETAAIYVEIVALPPGAPAPSPSGDDPAIAQAEALVEALDRLAPAGLLDFGLARLPDGREVKFNVDATADQWVVASVDGVPADRDLTSWPRLSSRGTSVDR